MILRFLVAASLVALCTAMPDCHLREVDYCVASMAVFVKNPTANADLETILDERCDAVDEMFDCIGNWTDECTTEAHQLGYDYVMKMVRKQKEGFCTPGTQLREELLKHWPCLKTAFTMASDNTCRQDGMVGLEAIVNADWRDRSRMGCCVMNRFRTCASEMIEDKCGLDTLMFVKKFGRLFGSRFMDIKCVDHFPESKLCYDLPPSGSRMVGAKNKKFKLMNHFLTMNRNMQ